MPPEAKRILYEAHAIENARRHGWALAEYCFRDEWGKPLRMAPFHREWHELIEAPQHCSIIAPRNSGKTENLEAAILRILGRNHDARIKYISAEPDLATGVVSAIGEHIEENPKLHKVYPDLTADKRSGWSRHSLFVKRNIIGSKEPSLEANGIMEGRSGGRATHLFLDDTCNWRNAIGQPKLREQVKSVITENWMNYPVPGGKIVYTATPWHINDYTADVSVLPGWAHWRRPAEDGHLGNLLWPERLTREFLEEKKSNPKTAAAYARQYLLQPISDEDTFFSAGVVDQMFDSNLTAQVILQQNNPVGYVAGVDLARSVTKEACYTVMLTAAVFGDGRRVLIDIWRRRITAVASWQAILESWRRFHHHLVLVENNAYQEAAVDYLHHTEPALAQAVRGFTTGIQKHDLEIGLPGMAGRFPLWTVPMGDGAHGLECACDKCQLRAELKSYPYGDYNDCVMAFWFADTAAERILMTSRSMGVAQMGGTRGIAPPPRIGEGGWLGHGNRTR